MSSCEEFFYLQWMAVAALLQLGEMDWNEKTPGRNPGLKG